MYKETYYKALVYVIMEVDKSQDLKSQSGNPGETMVSLSQQPQDSGGASILVQDQKTGKIQCSTSKARRQEEFSLIWGKFSLFFFFPTRPSSDWMRPTYIWEGNLLYLVSHNQFKCYVQVCSVMADSLQTHGL